MAYDRLAPLDTLERLVAQLLTLTANVNRDTKRHPAPFSVEEFLPDPFVPTMQERKAHFTAVMAEFEANRQKRKQKPN